MRKDIPRWYCPECGDLWFTYDSCTNQHPLRPQMWEEVQCLPMTEALSTLFLVGGYDAVEEWVLIQEPRG